MGRSPTPAGSSTRCVRRRSRRPRPDLPSSGAPLRRARQAARVSRLRDAGGAGARARRGRGASPRGNEDRPGMKTFLLVSDRVSLAVTETGAHLSDVAFVLPDGRRVAPMHTAPWADEPLGEDMPPVLRVLRGDFFCAPFGAATSFPARRHGLPANGTWRPTPGRRRAGGAPRRRVMGAAVSRCASSAPRRAMVYRRTRCAAAAVSRSVTTPCSRRATAAARLRPGSLPAAAEGEVPPQGSILRYPQEFADHVLRCLQTAARSI